MANDNQQQIGIGIQLGVNGGADMQSATEQIQELNKNIAKTGKADVAKPMQSLKQELRQAITLVGQLANAGQQGTVEFAAAARRVTELRNNIDEMNNSLRAFDPDNKLRVFGNAAGAGIRAVGGYTASLQLLGIESENATEVLAKLQAVSSLADSIDGVLDLQDSYKDLLRIFGIGLASTEVQTVANTANAISTEAQAVAQGGLTTAVAASTTGFKLLRIAMVSLGIGALVAVVSYLVANWDSLKKSVSDLFPSLNGAGDLFIKIKNTAIGVGNTIVQFLIAPFKTLGKLLSGDFKGALAEFQNGLNVTSNFNKGKLIGEVSDAKAANMEKLANDIKYQESRIKLMKAAGKDTTAIERDLLNKKLRFNKEDQEKYKELLEEKAIFEASTAKKIEDAADAKRKEKASKDKAARDKELADIKSQLDEVKKNSEAALRVIAESSSTERKLALDDIEAKYKKEFELLEKRKKDIKDYNLQFSNLTNARKIEEQKTNKRFDDDINAYLKSVQGDTVNSYQKTIDEINKVIDEKLKNATPEQTAALNLSRTEQVTRITKLKTLDDASSASNVNATKIENENRPNELDTPQEAAAKVANISAAKLNAENAAFELKKAQFVGQNQQLAQLQAEHEANITSINDRETKSRIELAKAEKEAKLNNLDAVSNGLSAVSGLVNEQSAANKLLGIAGATIDSYVGFNKSLAQGGFLGFAGAVAVLTSGLANVRKIMSVKIPNTSNSAGGLGGFSAPQINSTVLSQANNGTNEIVNAVQTDKKQVVEAVITQKSFKQYEAKQQLISNQSKY